MNDWVQCVHCGRKNNMSPKRGVYQSCRYCGGLVLWKHRGPHPQDPSPAGDISNVIGIIVIIICILLVSAALS